MADSDEDCYDDVDDDDLNVLLNRFVENAPDVDEAPAATELAGGEPAPVPVEPSAAVAVEATLETPGGQAGQGEPLPLQGPDAMEEGDKAIYETPPQEMPPTEPPAMEKEAFRPIPTPNRLILKHPADFFVQIIYGHILL